MGHIIDRPTESLRRQVEEYYKSRVTLLQDDAGALKTVERFVDKPSEEYKVVFDTETTGLDPWSGVSWRANYLDDSVEELNRCEPFALQLGLYDIGTDRLWCVFLPIKQRTTRAMAAAKAILENPGTTKIGHNIKFDIEMAATLGIRVQGKLWDTLSATRMTHDRESSHNLNDLANMFSGRPPSYGNPEEDALKAWLKRARAKATRSGKPKHYVNYSFVPRELMQPYALKDIWDTFLIESIIRPEIEENYAELFDMEMQVVDIALAMENRGVKIDVAYCLESRDFLREQAQRLERLLKATAKKYGEAEFNPGSHKQLLALFKKMFDPEDLKKRGGKMSSDRKVITGLFSRYSKDKERIEFLSSLLQHRSSLKMANTYFDALANKGRATSIIHCNLKVGDTATGRFACTDPNLQNIPKPPEDEEKAKQTPQVRGAFIPRAGYRIAYFDYSQIELRVFALFCQEPVMLRTLESEDGDIHSATAEYIWGECTKETRRRAKTVNFGIIYGMGIDGLAEALGIGRSLASEFFRGYYDKFPRIKRLLSVSQRQLFHNGYAEDMFLRRYHVPIERAYILVNSLVQGASANVLKYAMIQTRRLISRLFAKRTQQLSACPLLVIHDEQVIEIRNDVFDETVPLIKVAMEEVVPILQYGVKTRVDVEYTDSRWANKQDYDVPASDLKRARKVLSGMYNDVVLDYNLRKVDWFLR